MTTQVRAVGKIFAAVGASIRPTPAVHGHVTRHVTLSTELLPAFQTFVRPVVRVRQYVARQLRHMRKLLITQETMKGIFKPDVGIPRLILGISSVLLLVL